MQEDLFENGVRISERLFAEAFFKKACSYFKPNNLKGVGVNFSKL